MFWRSHTASDLRLLFHLRQSLLLIIKEVEDLVHRRFSPRLSAPDLRLLFHLRRLPLLIAEEIEDLVHGRSSPRKI